MDEIEIDILQGDIKGQYERDAQSCLSIIKEVSQDAESEKEGEESVQDAAQQNALMVIHRAGKALN